MDVYTWVIFLYVAGTLIVGWFLLNEVGPNAHRRKDKHVGPTYWGIYNGAVNESDKTIALRDFSNDIDELGYSAGKAVKSGRV